MSEANPFPCFGSAVCPVRRPRFFQARQQASLSHLSRLRRRSRQGSSPSSHQISSPASIPQRPHVYQRALLSLTRAFLNTTYCFLVPLPTEISVRRGRDGRPKFRNFQSGITGPTMFETGEMRVFEALLDTLRAPILVGKWLWALLTLARVGDIGLRIELLAEGIFWSFFLA